QSGKRGIHPPELGHRLRRGRTEFVTQGVEQRVIGVDVAAACLPHLPRAIHHRIHQPLLPTPVTDDARTPAMPPREARPRDLARRHPQARTIELLIQRAIRKQPLRQPQRRKLTTTAPNQWQRRDDAAETPIADEPARQAVLRRRQPRHRRRDSSRCGRWEYRSDAPLPMRGKYAGGTEALQEVVAEAVDEQED